MFSALLPTVRRYLFTGYLLNSSGTTGQATLPIISSFFRDQRFPENWFRRSTPFLTSTNGPIVSQLLAGVGVAPGRNNEHGVYVADPPAPAPFNVSLVRQFSEHSGIHGYSTFIRDASHTGIRLETLRVP
jgi:hypothetical protein